MQEPRQREYSTWFGSEADKRPAVLVTGATGGVGRRVVGKLLARGARVRALVRDLDKARELLEQLPRADGATLEVVAADLSQPKTVVRGAFDSVRAVVSCAAAKVQPVEGDADRAKCAPGHSGSAHKGCAYTKLESSGKLFNSLVSTLQLVHQYCALARQFCSNAVHRVTCKSCR